MHSMKKIYKYHRGYLLTPIFLSLIILKLEGQSAMPDVFIRNNISDQLNYLEEKTRIYEDYRAIREDMFQKVKKNITDTLRLEYKSLNELSGTINILNIKIDTLKTDLAAKMDKLDEATRTKNSISLFGIELNKVTYNSIMWLIILGLATLLAIGFLVFKRNLAITRSTKNELNDLKAEFQEYRKSSREAREKMSMDHFNEIRRLKGG
jgi:hypothetical protein